MKIEIGLKIAKAGGRLAGYSFVFHSFIASCVIQMLQLANIDSEKKLLSEL